MNTTTYPNETNGLTNGHDYHRGVDYAHQMTLSQLAQAGGHVSRVRVLADNWGGRLMCDLSYVHAELPDGTTVPLHAPLATGPLYGPKGLKARLVQWAQEEGVYAKALGLLDESNWSVLR